MALIFNGSTINTINYSGKNLQPIKDWSKRTINGVTCYIKDGVGYLNGTSTAGSWQQTEIGTIILPAGTYTIYFWTNFVQTTDPQLLSKIGLGLRNSAYDNLYQCNTNKYRTFTLTEQQTFNIVFWWQTDGMVFNNIWIKSMVRPGTYDPSTEYDQYGANNDVKMLKYNNTIVWCKPLTFTANASGVTGRYYKEATSEPTATTGTLSSGATIHYDDSLSIKYNSEVKTSTSTTSPSSVKAPVLTNQYTGSYGVNVKNNNSFSVDVYCRVGNSGSYSKKATLSANKSTSLVGLTHTEHTTAYVYFKASAKRTTTTTTNYYSCTSSGIHKTKTIETPLSTGDVATEIKAKAIDDVTITISNSSTSSPTTSTSSTTIQSKTSQLTMHR